MLVEFGRENLFILDENNTEIEGRFPNGASQFFHFEVVDSLIEGNLESTNFDGSQVKLYCKYNPNDQYKAMLNPIDSTEEIVFNETNINKLRAKECSKTETFKFSLEDATSDTKVLIRILFY